MLPLAAADSDSESETRRGRPEWRRHSQWVSGNSVNKGRGASCRVGPRGQGTAGSSGCAARALQAQHMVRAHGNTPDPRRPTQAAELSRRLVTGSAKVTMLLFIYVKVGLTAAASAGCC
jgi:hypothetical protein